jgi:predicted DNA-binding WGR domain protein
MSNPPNLPPDVQEILRELAEIGQMMEAVMADDNSILPREPTTRTPWNRREATEEEMATNKDTRRFESSTGGSSKFWEITTDTKSKTYEVRWGRIGAKGTTRSYGPLSSVRLRNEVNKKVTAKLAKGYVEVKIQTKPKFKSNPNELSGEDLIYELDF